MMPAPPAPAHTSWSILEIDFDHLVWEDEKTRRSGGTARIRLRGKTEVVPSRPPNRAVDRRCGHPLLIGAGRPD